MKKKVLEDLTGKRFGLLTVLNSGIKIEMECEIRSGSNCKCDCGTTLDVVNKYLKRGSKDHCGQTSCAIKSKQLKMKQNLGVE